MRNEQAHRIRTGVVERNSRKADMMWRCREPKLVRTEKRDKQRNSEQHRSIIVLSRQEIQQQKTTPEEGNAPGNSPL